MDSPQSPRETPAAETNVEDLRNACRLWGTLFSVLAWRCTFAIDAGRAPGSASLDLIEEGNAGLLHAVRCALGAVGEALGVVLRADGERSRGVAAHHTAQSHAPRVRGREPAFDAGDIAAERRAEVPAHVRIAREDVERVAGCRHAEVASGELRRPAAREGEAEQRGDRRAGGSRTVRFSCAGGESREEP